MADFSPTPGSTTATSYADLDTAISYAESRIGVAASAFRKLSADKQEMALISATIDIDSTGYLGGTGFIGTRTSVTQALEFPRNGATIIPLGIVRATIELAMTYAPALATATLTTTARSDIQQDTIGPITTRYFDRGKVLATSAERFPPIVQRLLNPFLRQTFGTVWGSGTAVRSS